MNCIEHIESEEKTIGTKHQRTWPMKKNLCWEWTSLLGATHDDVYTAVPVPTTACEGSDGRQAGS